MSRKKIINLLFVSTLVLYALAYAVSFSFSLIGNMTFSTMGIVFILGEMKKEGEIVANSATQIKHPILRYILQVFLLIFLCVMFLGAFLYLLGAHF